MKLLRDIAYAPQHGFRGLADLFIPEAVGSSRVPLSLVIHGGGWDSMDKSSLHPVARLLAEEGFAAFCPNYRLLGDAKWPACGDDCLRAAAYVVGNASSFDASISSSPLLILGASAGGHLAMMTGLRLPKSQVAHIVSLAGPSDIGALFTDDGCLLGSTLKDFFGKCPSASELDSASPLGLFKPGCPPLSCLHSAVDALVPPKHSEMALAKCRAAGSRAELFSFEGKDIYHGFWVPGPAGQAASERRLVPELEAELRRLAAKLRKDMASY